MSFALYGHPFSSYTQKVVIALYENRTPFEFRCIGPDTPQHVAEWMRRWPLRKFPLLLDGEREIVESSIIIEYLQLAHPGVGAPPARGPDGCAGRALPRPLLRPARNEPRAARGRRRADG